MPGYEVVGKEEQEAVNRIFTESNGVLYRYGFDKLRNGIYRVDEFEKAFAKKFNVKYAHAVSSGSSALKIALQALGCGKGSDVLTQCHTFIATVEAIVETGAKPIVTNIDKTLNMGVEDLSMYLDTLPPDVIVPVHMSGVSCDMDKITKVSNSIPILEDNAQSPGGTYKGKHLGTIGDIGIFSFDGGKMLTTGEGGIIVTNNKELYLKCRSISDHGHAYNNSKPRGEDDCTGLGFNYKMNELQGAVGLEQLKKLDSTIEKHRKNKWLIKSEVDANFRHNPDPKGDIGDSISFFFKTQNETKRFVKYWLKEGMSTKNIPDAMKWHFAWYWDHINYEPGKKHLRLSYDILNKTVSIPISINMDIDKTIKKLKEGIK